MSYKSIKVADLFLDLNNPRFPEPVQNQREALHKMLDVDRDGIINLMRHMSENGSDPSDILLVHEAEKNKYIVGEGNRRTTALKLLNAPSLASGHKSATRVKNAAAGFNNKIGSLYCKVFENAEEYVGWVSLKHTGENQGRGRVRWKAIEKDRFIARTGTLSMGAQILLFLENNKENFPNSYKDKERLKITNLNRLLGDPKVRSSLGLAVEDKFLFCSQSFQWFIKNLEKVLSEMVQIGVDGKNEFTVDRIRHKGDRAVFISDVGLSQKEECTAEWKLVDVISGQPEEVPSSDRGDETDSGTDADSNSDNDKNDESQDAGTKDDGEAADSNNGGKSEPEGPAKPSATRPPAKDRNNMIPSTFRPNFGSNIRCHRIFNELKNKLRNDDSPNAIAIMLRVFVDLSVTSYIDVNNIVLNGKVGLHDKIVAVTSDLQVKGKLSNKDKSNIQAFSSQTMKSSGNLHQYIHNEKTLPSKIVINSEWDNLQQLFSAIWH